MFKLSFKILSLFFLISLTFQAEDSKKFPSSQHPLSRSKEMKKLFKLFLKLNQKKYNSLNEYKFRYKTFKNNLFYFIKKNDNVKDRVNILRDDHGKLRLYIIPNKRLNVDFYDAEEAGQGIENDSLRFEINKFSDMSEQEFESIFSLDQSFFDESKNPPYFAPEHQNFKPGNENIENYLKILQKTDPNYKIKSKPKQSKQKQPNKAKSPNQKQIPEHLVNVTPHFSSDPNHKSIWELGQHKDPMLTTSDGIHSDFFYHSRVLENHIELPESNSYISLDGNKLPLEINWRDLDAIGEIKDQFRCNACYAFAAIGALEARYRIKTGRNITLSEQEIVDCSSANNGCIGGLPHKVFTYIKDQDINFMNDYPYDALRDASCRKKRMNQFDGAQVVSYTNLPLGILSLLKNLTSGPIAVISYSSYAFRNYAGGIFGGEGCRWKYKANHASVLIGYNLRRPSRYLYFKNGWGTDWGELGYYKVRIDSLHKHNKSHCLIAAHNYNSIPILK